MDVLVFKTNLLRKKDVKVLTPLFKSSDEIVRWNVDLKDIDKILRVEATCRLSQEIQDLVKKAGFNCEELID